MNRVVMLACVAGLSSLAALAPGSAYAADTGARGEADALRVTVAGERNGTGPVVASNDGTGETKSGTVNPPVSALPDQAVLSLGVLAQDAVARDDGTSAACAGVAGDGGSVVEIGDTGCITPGADIDLQLAELDLAVLLEGEVIEGSGALGDVLSALGAGDVTTVVAALQSGLDELESQVGEAGLVLDAGAVETHCSAGSGAAEGATLLTDAGVSVEVPGLGEEHLLTFAPAPARNTKLFTDLHEVSSLLLDELRTAFDDNLDAIADPVLGTAIDLVQADVVDAAVAQVAPELAPLEKDVLEVVLNRQPDDGADGSVQVTGIAAEVLPAAAEAGAPSPLLAVDVANVACGPMALAPADDDGGDSDSGPGDPATTPVTDTAGNPVPTTVNAGASGDATPAGMLVSLAGLLALGALARVRRTARG
jgi:hypothetical protein